MALTSSSLPAASPLGLLAPTLLATTPKTKSSLWQGWLFVLAFVFSALPSAGNEVDQRHSLFFRKHCLDCHQGESAEGRLDLEQLSADLHDPKVFATWVQICDRIQSGEMPPKESSPVPAAEVDSFLGVAKPWLQAAQQREFAELGRVRGRRLTNVQLERTLHDLLGIDIPLAREMPDEPVGSEFSTYSESQSMSHFHLEQHLKVIDLALDEAFRRVADDNDTWQRRMTAKQISRTQTRCREPEFIDGHSVVWSSRLIFYGRLPATRANESGWYRIRFRASSLKQPEDHGVWCTVRTGACVASAPLLSWVGSFEATKAPKEFTFEGWLPEGHMFEIRPADRTLKDARFQGGQVANGEGGKQNVPGLAIEWLELERIHHGPGDRQLKEWLIGDLDLVTDHRKGGKVTARLNSQHPQQDLQRLLKRFAARAFRRPVDDDDVALYTAISQRALDDGEGLLSALRLGYRSILCSPRFLYFSEQPGALDDYAIASRLSYFLWNSMPDEPLLQLASQGKLRQRKVLESEVERMLTTGRGKDFVPNFASQWLELSQIDFTEPDPRLYPDFDIVVQNSMLEETHQFLQTLLDEDLSVTHFVDSPFTYLNSRLARYYDIPYEKPSELTRVALTKDDRRGGLLAQGAVLKVTANGTNTSPVLRGVWVSNRILGVKIPPPPENVPAIEPDIRGAKTIRDQLAMHRNDESCAVCHVKIDPPGFALENFDAAGRWRDKYLKLDGKKLVPQTVIDPSYTLSNGETFADFEEFKALMARQPENLARNFAEKLLAYGTGAPIAFSDRPAIDQLVQQVGSDGFGVRSIVKAVVASPVFLHK